MTRQDQIFVSDGANGIDTATPVGTDEGLFIDGDDGKIKRAALSSWPGGGGGGSSPILPWEFDNTTTDADPGSGKFRFNNATLANVTFIYINKTADNGIDGSELIEALRNGDEVYIQQEDDETKAALFTVTGSPTDATTYYKIPVIYKDEGTGGLFTNGTNCSFMYYYNSSPQLTREGDYSFVTMSGDQANATTGTVVNLDTEQVGNIDFDASTKKWTLKAGRIYRLHCSSRSSGHAGTDSIQLTWQNASGPIGKDSLTRGLNANVNASEQASALTIYAPSVDTEVWVQVENNSTGTVDISGTWTWAEIIQVAKTALAPLEATGEYLQLGLSADQSTDLTAGNPVKLNLSNGNIDYNAGTYRATLKAGFTYKLTGNIYNTLNNANEFATYVWYDITNSEPIGNAYSGNGLGSEAICISVSHSTSKGNDQSSAVAIITPVEDIEVELRIDSVSGTLAQIWATWTNATIEQVAVGALNPLISPAKYNIPAATSIANAATWTSLSPQYSNKQYDDDNLISAGIFTAPHDGHFYFPVSLYLVTGGGWTTGENLALRLAISTDGGSTWPTTRNLDIETAQTNHTVRADAHGGAQLKLNRNDKVRVEYLQNSGGAINTDGADSVFGVFEIPTAISTAAPPTFYAYADSDAGQSLTADTTDIVMEDIESDAWNMINVSNGRITPPVTSRVRIIINIDPSGVGTPLLKLYKTGVFLRKGSRNTGGESTQAVFEEIIDPATDYLTIRNGFAATLDGTAAHNWIRIEAEPV